MATVGDMSGSEGTKSIYEPFIDTKVNRIRLLTLGWEIIDSKWVYSAKLTSHTLGPELKYNCISYVWGDRKAPPKRTIILNGVSRPLLPSIYPILELIRKKFPNNIHTSGTTLAHSTNTTTPSSTTQPTTNWWIDYLCINQDDVEERNSQVAIMKDIYRGAQEAVVWLGEEDERPLESDVDMEVRNCSGGIKSLQKLREQRYDFYGNTRNKNNLERKEKQKWQLRGTP
jgi:hypothetical protein